MVVLIFSIWNQQARRSVLLNIIKLRGQDARPKVYKLIATFDILIIDRCIFARPCLLLLRRLLWIVLDGLPGHIYWHRKIVGGGNKCQTRRVIKKSFDKFRLSLHHPPPPPCFVSCLRNTGHYIYIEYVYIYVTFKKKKIQRKPLRLLMYISFSFATMFYFGCNTRCNAQFVFYLATPKSINGS